PTRWSVALLAAHVVNALLAYGISALAIVVPLTALPAGSAGALGVAALFVAIHLGWTASAARNEIDFRTVEGLSSLAARWLSAVDEAAAADTNEVVVPFDPATAALSGMGHRLFLCASYDVRAVPDVHAVPPRPGLVVVEALAAALADDLRGWRSVVRDCAG